MLTAMNAESVCIQKVFYKKKKQLCCLAYDRGKQKFESYKNDNILQKKSTMQAK